MKTAPASMQPIDTGRLPVEPIHIPWAELDPATLRAVVEAFVLREGTDYGRRERQLPEKVAQVLAQIRRGDAVVVFDPDSETTGIVLK